MVRSFLTFAAGASLSAAAAGVPLFTAVVRLRPPPMAIPMSDC
jgi:hypothetical protein